MNGDYAIQTIRSHENHYHDQGCDMLGGLSGFKPKNITNRPSTFEEYYDGRDELPWAQDQYLMVSTFLYSQDPKFLQEKFLDCPINNQNRKSKVPSREITKEQMNEIQFNKEQEEILTITDQLCDWAGEPCDARASILLPFLSFDNDASRYMKDVVIFNNSLKEFYTKHHANL